MEQVIDFISICSGMAVTVSLGKAGVFITIIRCIALGFLKEVAASAVAPVFIQDERVSEAKALLSPFVVAVVVLLIAGCCMD